MGSSLERRALVCLLFLAAGCAGPEPPSSEKVTRIAEERAATDGSMSTSPALGALPRFVDGGLRCGVEHRPSPHAPSGTSGPVEGGPAARVRSLGVERARDGVHCVGPDPWCALVGSLKEDRDNEQLRKELDQVREWHREKAEELRERVHRAEEIARRERRLRLEVLRQLHASTGESIYLTNDDSMSVASPQRLIYNIDHGLAVPAEEVRPHELLNYFSFQTLPVNPGEVFSVLPELSPHPARKTDLTLALSVRGKDVNVAERRPLNLTYVMDRSGSMASPGRLDFVKRGLIRSFSELKSGDMIQVLLFDSVTCPLVQNFVVGRDPLERLVRLIQNVEPKDGSNLQDGLAQGYALTNRAYRSEASNRVILITDADSSGVVESDELIALTAAQYDARRVRLSAVAVGVNASDRLLDRLTEAGRGASVFLSSSAEVEAIFGHRFSSLVETIATDVYFRLELPPSIRLRAFYGEEASPRREKVQSVHFFAGTEQMYLANLEKLQLLEPTDLVRLSIEYRDPETNEQKASDFTWRADELEMATGSKSKFATRNLNKARMVATFGYQLRYMAEHHADILLSTERPLWSSLSGATPSTEHSPAPIDGQLVDRRLAAVTHCRRVQGRLDAFSAQLGGEKEATRIVELWRTYCQSYEELARPHLIAVAATVTEKSQKMARRETVPERSPVIRLNEFTPEEEVF